MGFRIYVHGAASSQSPSFSPVLSYAHKTKHTSDLPFLSDFYQVKFVKFQQPNIKYQYKGITEYLFAIQYKPP
ncbi:MAG: hypothetical protein C4545_00945 [Anaerolineaceae bacterium]|jgi:hypothetical protein|nr:MAG: hypothetical protein C4545_00945 [Anaerolineaceae bacterium]